MTSHKKLQHWIGWHSISTKVVLVLTAIALIVVGAWLVYSTTLATIPLKPFATEDYSLLVPENYTKRSEAFGDSTVGGLDVGFEKKTGPDPEDLSLVRITSVNFSNTEKSRREHIESMNKNNLIEEGPASNLGYTMTHVTTHRDFVVNGLRAWRVSALMEKRGKQVAYVDMTYFLGQRNKRYMLEVGGPTVDQTLNHSIDRIVHSFTEK